MYPTIVVTIPHNIAAIVTFTTSLNPNKTRSPGIGDAVPGALLTSWKRGNNTGKCTANEVCRINGIGFAETTSACVKGSIATAIVSFFEQILSV